MERAMDTVFAHVSLSVTGKCKT